MVRLCDYSGGKARFIKEIRALAPADFRKAWETHGGTAAVSANIFSGLDLEEVVITELEVGQCTLLKAVQEKPGELCRKLLETEYTVTEFEEAEKAEGDEARFVGCTNVEIAFCKYVLNNQSYNGGGSVTGCRLLDNFRTVEDLKREKPNATAEELIAQAGAQIASMVYAAQTRDRYKRQILPNINGTSECLRNAQIINTDMMDMLDEMVDDAERFIFCDPPYENGVDRDVKLYIKDTDLEWHINFCKRLVYLHGIGKLNAKLMICGTIKFDENGFKGRVCGKVYNQYLLKIGFKMVVLDKKVYSSTIIKENTKNKLSKPKRAECVWINYEPAEWIVGPENVFGYNDIFGEEGVEDGKE